MLAELGWRGDLKCMRKAGGGRMETFGMERVNYKQAGGGTGRLCQDPNSISV